jgi:hypothetical protein
LHPIPEKTYPIDQIAYTIFAVGDMGALSARISDPVIESLKEKINLRGANSCIAFLGDNIYPRGMPLPEDSKRDRAEDRMNAQLNIVKNYPGQVIFIPGNHDWNKGHGGGWEYVKRQEEYIKEAIGRPGVFLPENGCPGPVLIDVNPEVAIIVINTQWWIQHGEKPIGSKDGCCIETPEEFFIKLGHMLERNKHKKIFVVAHHPLYSNALHGGKFTFKQHLFPLTDWKKKFYMPLPGVGSLYLLYRKLFGAREDMSYPTYRKMRKKLLNLFHNYANLVYSAGHDHNLQYIKKGQQHYIVSGSGSKTAFVQKGGKALFAEAKRGYFVVNYLNNNEVWLEAWVLNKDKGQVELQYMTKLDD